MKDRTEVVNAVTFTASYNLLIKNQQTFDTDNYKSASNSDTRETGKIIRLFRCFGCDKCFSAQMMSGFLMVCKNCLNAEHIEDERTRRRFSEKILKRIDKFLRGRL